MSERPESPATATPMHVIVVNQAGASSPSTKVATKYTCSAKIPMNAPNMIDIMTKPAKGVGDVLRARGTHATASRCHVLSSHGCAMRAWLPCHLPFFLSKFATQSIARKGSWRAKTDDYLQPAQHRQVWAAMRRPSGEYSARPEQRAGARRSRRLGRTRAGGAGRGRQAAFPCAPCTDFLQVTRCLFSIGHRHLGLWSAERRYSAPASDGHGGALNVYRTRIDGRIVQTGR